MFDGFSSGLASVVYKNKYSLDGKEDWPDTARRVAHAVMDPYLPHLADRVQRLIEDRKLMPGGRYLYAAGRPYPQVNNCALLSAEDSREGWADLMSKVTNCLMTGAGVGVVYSKLRPSDAHIKGMGGTSTGPLALMQMVNEAGRHIIQGGARRAALWAGLHWNHPDALRFTRMKDWIPLVKQGKKEDFNFPAPMDGTNISIILDDDFFAAYKDRKWSKSYKWGNAWYSADHDWAQAIYWGCIGNMLRTGEPGFSIDIGDNTDVNLRNACTELCSKDDSDVCNLASLNLSRIRNKEEFTEAIRLSMAFLVCGTLYSKLPYEKMYQVREKNRRLGLGLMGLHEWMIQRDYRYGPSDELGDWMDEYVKSGDYASEFADQLGISRPVATRSIAPNGSIGIVAETTCGIEPIFSVALKRRYLSGKTWKAQYIVDPTAERLIKQGKHPEMIEDSLDLAEDYERRIHFQGWLQKRIDHGVSSTLNIPQWGSSINNESTVDAFGKTLFKHLPLLRGITAYPDGSRDGQPLVKAPYAEAVKHLGREFEDGSADASMDETLHEETAEFLNHQVCKGGVCGA